jgi:O-antigen ligase
MGPATAGRGSRSIVANATVALTLSAAAAFVMTVVPTSLLTWETVPFALTGNAIFLLLAIYTGRSATRVQQEKRLAFVLWFLLISSEEFFVRRNEIEDTFSGNMAMGAFAEAAVWVLIFLVLAVFTARNHLYLRRLFIGPYKWMTLFGLLCVSSCVYSPKPAFSLAWGFKLCIVILVLLACASHIQNGADLAGFLKATVCGVAFLAIVPPVRALFLDVPVFQDGRLGNSMSPTGMSEVAGVLLVASLACRSIVRAKSLSVLAIAAVVIMFMAGGKAAILSTTLSVTLFFLARRKVGSAALGLAVIVLIGVIVVMTTPVSSYLVNYADSDQATTLSGRMGLWELALPAVLSRPLLGNGYATSRFFAVQVGGIPWSPGHMHNGFLEVLYNNGVIGLALLLLIQAAIIIGLVKAMFRFGPTSPMQPLAVGGIALFANTLIDGMFNASFGGRATGIFVVMLSLVVISERMLALKPNQVAEPNSQPAYRMTS